MRTAWLTAIVLATSFSTGACSSSSKSTGGTGGSGPVDTGVVDGGCVDTTKVFDGTQCVAHDTAVATCKAESTKAAPGSKVDDTTCGAGCACTTCTQDMENCNTDPAGYCTTVLECALAHNCNGIACYAKATCQDVVDGASGGLTSLSVALAQKVGDCITKANCTPGCQ